MTEDAICASEDDTLVDAAMKMRDGEVGALPICSDDHRLMGMITDRDIVVKCIAEGGDPRSELVGNFVEGMPATITPDDSIEDVLETMIEHKVRRLPVVEGEALVGVLSQADVAQYLPQDRVGDLVEAISAAPGNN